MNAISYFIFIAMHSLKLRHNKIWIPAMYKIVFKVQKRKQNRRENEK